MNTPFIHVFASPIEKYVYDVNTNAIIKINNNVFTYLENIEYEENLEIALEKTKAELKPEELADTLEYFEMAKEKGLFSSKRARKIEHPNLNIYDDLSNSYMHQLILQITQNCNLRCEYCPYSGIKYNDRTHNNRSMSEATGKKAIDFFLERTIDSPSVDLGFYGGEPLLEFELIQKLVAYFETKFQGKDYTFSLTTNGTLLTEDKIRYFAEKNFQLLVSLDGPKYVHNRSRCFVSGAGSHDKVIEGIKLAEKIVPEYTKEKIHINAVLTEESNFCSINEFFTSYDSIKDLTMMASVVSDVNLKEEYQKEEDQTTQAKKAFNEEIEYEMFKYYLAKTGRPVRYSPIVKDWENGTLEQLRRKRIQFNGLHDQLHPSGPCIPGVFRIFITVDEKIYPCERLCEKGDTCTMGTLDQGIDKAKACSFLNIGELTEKQCLDCWAWLYCSACLLQANDPEKNQLTASKRLSFCNQNKANAEAELLRLCTLKEFGISDNNNDNIWEVDEVATTSDDLSLLKG